MSSSGRSQEKSPCSLKNIPVPLTLNCPYCGEEAEIWTDESSADCPFCKQRIMPTA